MERDFKLSKEVYFETIWYIRQYPSLMNEYESLIWQSRNDDGQPKGTQISDPTFKAVERLEKIGGKLDPIKKGLANIPEEYRQGLLDNIIYKIPYPYYATLSTWKRWRRRLVWYIAQEREKQK